MDSEAIRQCGAVCQVGDEIVLVTNKSGSRWVIPKGHLEPEDCNEAERAVQEAWEEAGVRGEVAGPLGHFFYHKRSNLYRVEVFLLERCRLSEAWPESSVRTRILVAPSRACEMVAEPELVEILKGSIDPG